MKKAASFIIAMLIFGPAAMFGQNFPNYPIPSYNVTVDGYANFVNLHSGTNGGSRKQRQVIVHLRSTMQENQNCHATIWIYSKDQTTILGPYDVACGETLTVGVDEREWGVFVDSETAVIVDVWYGEGALLRPKGNQKLTGKTD
jgi:hypothetical protein